jgi:hypothetical protein
MPTTIEAFIVLILGIAPGFVGIRGYSRRRYKTVPDRDLYALAGAGVVSAIWLGVVWLVAIHFGNPLRDWGIVPFDGRTVERNRVAVACFGLGVICAPYLFGVFGALVMDRLEGLSHSRGTRRQRGWKLIRKTGFFRPPTAWDRAWLHFTRFDSVGEVLVQMEDGLIVRGGFGGRSQADLSPNPPSLFLESGYGYRVDAEGKPSQIEGLSPAGVYLSGENINAIYFRPTSEAGRTESKTDPGLHPKNADTDPAAGVPLDSDRRK